jgi:negative regulator of sigma E activity
MRDGKIIAELHAKADDQSSVHLATLVEGEQAEVVRHENDSTSKELPTFRELVAENWPEIAVSWPHVTAA